MSGLALALFAAARDAHAVDHARRSHGFDVFAAAFDEQAELARLEASRLRWLERSSEAFPPRLRSIHDPPPGLFLRGDGPHELLARPAVAIVGARACSDYGAHVARALGRELASAGVVVVSGLATKVLVPTESQIELSDLEPDDLLQSTANGAFVSATATAESNNPVTDAALVSYTEGEPPGAIVPASAGDPLDEVPTAEWYLRSVGGQFGPAGAG